MKGILCFILLLIPQLGWGEEEKSLDQLRSDLQKIERSIEITKQKMKEVKDVSFLPDLYFVIAELYVDKSRYLYTINRQENPNKPVNELDFSDSQRAKKQAIETYQRYIENFPRKENLDKAHFFMAHEYRELGQNEEMAKVYLKLTQSFPKSIYWEESQLILGDLYLEQKKDPKMALEFYQKILERPSNPYMALARYKSGWCLINLNRFYEALLAFEGVITIDSKISNESLPEIYKKSDVRKDALVALVWPYSEQKKLDPSRADALRYFERMIPDRETMLKVFTRLGKRLLTKKMEDQAVPVYLRLIELTNDLENKISAIDGFYEAFRGSKKYWSLEGLSHDLGETVNRARFSLSLSIEDKARVEKNFEVYMRDIATRLHGQAKSSRQEVIYRQAVEAYEDYLATFGRSKFSNAMLLNLAESYFAIRNYSRAGYKYEELSKRPTRAARKSFLDSAIQSYALALKSPEKFSKLDLAEAREGFREVGAQFVRSFPKDPANPMILFNIGHTFYDERDFDKAVSSFKIYIYTYPRHKEVTTAGQLILDSFNQREDYDGLIKAGKELIANSQISNVQFKKDVSEIIKQAEYRKIQDQVGDPKSRNYAQKLLGFAAKYQGSALGDQALYEAFVSYKKKKDPAAYDPGEQLLLKHGDSKYAKEVVGAMGQMALNTADYRRAAKYFETYSRKYPNDPLSKQLLKNAATMREVMGDFRESAEDYRDLGEIETVAEKFVQAQDWNAVTQTLAARPSKSLKTNYWMGLALYRLGQFDQARSYLALASQAATANFQDKTHAAHALYLLAGMDLKDYQAIQLGTGDEAAAVKNKTAKLDKLTQQMNAVISFGNGRWTIAALYELGRANEEFSQFLKNASVPAGLDAGQQAQYKSLIGQKSGQYKSKALGYFKSCLDNAQKYEVFTGFVKGCQSQGRQAVDESVEERILAKASDVAPAEAALIRKKLFDDPKSTILLMSLAQAYLRSRDYAMARTIINRILEIKPKDASAIANLGLTSMFMNDLDSAAGSFRSALQINAREPLALYGMAALYRNFSFSNKFQTISPRLRSAKKPPGALHPWMTGL